MKYYVIDKEDRQDVPNIHHGRSIKFNGWHLYHCDGLDCWCDDINVTEDILIFNDSILDVVATMSNIANHCNNNNDGFIRLEVEYIRLLDLFLTEEI